MNFEYQLVPSTHKVFPGGEGLSASASPALVALKGETVSFQLIYRWNAWGRAWGQVQVRCPLPARARTVELVPCDYPCNPRFDQNYLTTQPGLYPDRLQELTPQGFPLVAGQWRSLWLDIQVDQDAPAGTYPVEVILTAQGETLCRAETSCQVLDLAMPKLPIPHTEWFHSDCLAQYYGVEVFSQRYWQLVENFVRTAAKRRCNMLLTPVFTPPLDTAVGGQRLTVQLVDVEEQSPGVYAFGFENFRRWVNMALSCGMEYIEISHLFSQWGAVAAPKIMGLRQGELCQLFGWDTDAGGSQYAAFLHQFLSALKVQLDDLGIRDKTYFHISDEPSMEQLGSYRKAWQTVQEDLKGYAVVDALSDHAFYKEGLVQQPVCALDHIEPFLQDRPEKLWGYYCTSQCVDVPNRFIAQPGQRTRVLGVLLYKFGLNGFLQWGYNFYNSQFSLYPVDPYRTTSADSAFPSGDPFVVYPGPDGQPEESLRFMLMDEAMADYCALTALEQRAGRDQALACLQGAISFSAYPQEEEWLLDLAAGIRRQAAQA